MSLGLILYILPLLSLSVLSYFFIDQNLVYLKDLYTGFAFVERKLTASLYVISVLLLFFFYFNLLRKLRSIRNLKHILFITVLISIFSYPAFLSYDVFNYLLTSKTLFYYGENPYIVMPIEFQNELWLSFTHAANKLALYGPSWIGLTGIPFSAGFGNFLLTIFSFKLFIVLFYIGTVYLLWLISKNIFSVALFALNPLVVIETLMSSHNDIVMMFFALLAIVFIRKKKILLAFLLLLGSILIKYATVFLIPVFIYTAVKIFRKENVNWDKVFFWSFILMFVIFLLSHFREEIYPWYAIWFLPFAVLVPNKKIILYTSLALSFGLLLRYIPFMLYGTHFGTVPLVKNLVTFIPPTMIVIYLKWLNSFR